MSTAECKTAADLIGSDSTISHSALTELFLQLDVNAEHSPAHNDVRPPDLEARGASSGFEALKREEHPECGEVETESLRVTTQDAPVQTPVRDSHSLALSALSPVLPVHTTRAATGANTRQSNGGSEEASEVWDGEQIAVQPREDSSAVQLRKCGSVDASSLSYKEDSFETARMDSRSFVTAVTDFSESSFGTAAGSPIEGSVEQSYPAQTN